MKSIRSRAAARSFVMAAVLVSSAAIAAPAASAHEGGANCQGALAEVGNTYQGSCTMPFQGFPIGVAGTYDSDPNHLNPPVAKETEIHVEILAKMASGPPRALGVECIDTTAGVARCQKDYNPIGTPVTGPAPAPEEIVALICNAHSHAHYSSFAPPAGHFACWSTDAGRQDLEDDHFFEDNGFEPTPAGEPDPGAPGPLGPLAGSGLTGTVTTVPFNTYLPDTLVVSRSLGLSYVNVDTASHDVVALEARRPDGSAPWCANFEDPEHPASQDCPLFWSPLIPGGGSETPVLGLADTKVGSTYTFYCSIHPYMTGTIQVVE